MTDVLIIYTGFIPTSRFCALEPLKALEKQNMINLHYKLSHKVTSGDLNNCDVLVLVRCSEDCELEIAQKCKKAGRKLIYVLDDDLFNVPPELECYAYFAAESVRSNMMEIMKLCDVLWATNPNLTNKYGYLFEKTVLIDEPFIGEFYGRKKDNDKVRIGFAGSVSHKAFVNDFLGHVIEKVYKKYGNSISIEFFGFKPEFSNRIPIKYIPYSNDYNSYCALMRERNWDIGLSPLEESEFSSCKYFNKYIEYSSYGIAGIYSDVEPYTFGIRNGENGMLAENTVDAWFGALRHLIDDGMLRKKIIAYSTEELKEKFTPEAISKVILEETDFLCTHKSNQQISYRKKSFIFSKLKIYTEIYGIMMPYMVIKKSISKISSCVSIRKRLNQIK